MSYLFDTDAIVELLTPHPAPEYLLWLAAVPREDQFTSAVVVGALYKAASRSPDRERHVAQLEERVLPAVTVLPFDEPVAKVYGQLAAHLVVLGTVIVDDDLKVAATALVYDLSVVTGDMRRYERVAELSVCTALVMARGG